VQILLLVRVKDYRQRLIPLPYFTLRGGGRKIEHGTCTICESISAVEGIGDPLEVIFFF